jgi:hypothetical protein
MIRLFQTQHVVLRLKTGNCDWQKAGSQVFVTQLFQTRHVVIVTGNSNCDWHEIFVTENRQL